jgi:hypothetical protein
MIATDGTAITFTTPVYVTVVNSIAYGGNSISTGQPKDSPINMLNGGYLFAVGDEGNAYASHCTAMTSLPEALWECIDENYSAARCAYGRPPLPPDTLDQGLDFDGTFIRLCDNNLAGLNSSNIWGPPEVPNCGLGLWINTVADSLPGNVHCFNGWRNDPENFDTNIDICLMHKSGVAQLSKPDSTRTKLMRKQGIALKPREGDTATQWFLLYAAIWQDEGEGLGFGKVMITAQKGDLNYDGKCDFADLPIFSGTFGTSQGDANYNQDADLDGNNKIDFADLPLFSGFFGQECSE